MTDKTFTVQVDGVGEFAFYRRTFRRGAQIAAIVEDALAPFLPEEERGTRAHNGNYNPLYVYACLTVQTAKAPPGWDLESVDAEDRDQVAQIFAVYAALRSAEDGFRKAGGGQPAGTGDPGK